MKECTEVLCNNILIFWNTFVACSRGVATLLLFLILGLKLFTNRRAVAIDYKHMIMTIPGEILFLVLGFHISSMIDKSSTNTINTPEYLAIFFILLLLLTLQYALERWSEDKLSGDLSTKIKVCITLMYLISIGIYIVSVYGG